MACGLFFLTTKVVLLCELAPWLLLSFYLCLIIFEGGLRPLFFLTTEVALLCELAPASLIILSLLSHFKRRPAATFFLTTNVALLCELAPAPLVILSLPNHF